MHPYDPPKSDSNARIERDAKHVVPGRFGIWAIAALSFCFGAFSLFGAWTFWRSPALLDGLSGLTYHYYLWRPLVLAVGFLGLSWKCFRYVDSLTHNPLNSTEVRRAHGGVWNWMAVMLAAFMILVMYHSLGG